MFLADEKKDSQTRTRRGDEERRGKAKAWTEGTVLEAELVDTVVIVY